MDSQTLRTFLKLSELLNFTKTADSLFLAQSTVTNRILELEQELGKTLFVRNRRGVTLSPEGLAYIPYAKRMLELEEASLSELHSLKRHDRRIRLGATNTIYECHLAEDFRRFMLEEKDCSIRITMGHSQDLLTQLQDGLLDVVYVYLPFMRAGYSCKCFVTDRLILVKDKANPSFPHGIHKDELQNTNYLYCDFALQEVGLFVRELFPAHFQFGFEIDNSTKLIPYLLHTDGISFLPESLARPYILDKSLVEIPLLDGTSPQIGCYQVHKSDVTIPDLLKR